MATADDTTVGKPILNNSLVMGEFEPAEVAPCALDKLDKKDRDFTHVRHMFATDEQYDIFCMLPGGTHVKQLILDELLPKPDQK